MVPQYVAVIADWLQVQLPDLRRDDAIRKAWDLIGHMEKEEYTVASLDPEP